MQIPDNWFADERGNTWLMNDDGNHVLWVRMNDKIRMEVTIYPGNYPGFYAAMLPENESTDEHLSEHINKKCVGWQVRKCNIEGVNVDADGMIADTADTKLSSLNKDLF